MKKLFITIAFVAAAMFSQAQGLFIGGNIGLTSTKYMSDAKEFHFEIAPNVGYMFADNMGVGLELGYGYKKETPVIGDDVKTSEFAFAPYFRYVFAQLDNFKFYGDVKVAFMFGKHGDDKTSGFGVGLVPGFSYDFTEHFAMVANLNILSIGYTQYKIEDAKQTNFGVGVNQNTDLSVGFVYNF